MINLEEIKSQLRPGDQRTISEATGYSKDYISMVLCGRRNNNEIVEAAKKIIENRKQLVNQLQDQQ